MSNEVIDNRNWLVIQTDSAKRIKVVQVFKEKLEDILVGMKTWGLNVEDEVNVILYDLTNCQSDLGSPRNDGKQFNVISLNGRNPSRDSVFLKMLNDNNICFTTYMNRDYVTIEGYDEKRERLKSILKTLGEEDVSFLKEMGLKV